MARKAGLGRGLDSLIPGSENGITNNAGTLVNISKILPNPRQPRSHMDPESLSELADSIREHGLLQPLIVTFNPQDDTYTLIAGERRLRAAQMAGLDMVPVIIRQADDQERLELALIENIQRSDLNPLDAAEAYQQLLDDFHLSHDEISIKVGKSRVSITNTLRLLKLSESAKNALLDGIISEGHARALLSLTNFQSQNAALQTIIDHQLSVRQAEELARKLTGIRRKPDPKTPVSAEIKAIEERLRSILGTKVTMRQGSKGGSITIFYFSDEELENIIEKISNFPA